ncbi:hypothetical protein RCZ03_26640 [Capnocytophaga catalasegens]|nr:hypothetical protein RCZ03_26640 [Capnocytophaga catalasegens]
MIIRKFLIIVSIIFLIGSRYFSIRYIKEICIQKENNPIENYFIIDKSCTSSYNESSTVKIHITGRNTTFQFLKKIYSANNKNNQNS